jgi:hypothetical protein
LQEFNVEMIVDLEEYYRVWWQGFKKYVLKEKVEAKQPVMDSDKKSDEITV